MGYGDSSAEVDAVRAPADLLAGYHDAVAGQVSAQLGRWGADDLAAVVDDSFDPPVTLATRLVSVAVDCARAPGPGGLRARAAGHLTTPGPPPGHRLAGPARPGSACR